MNDGILKLPQTPARCRAGDHRRHRQSRLAAAARIDQRGILLLGRAEYAGREIADRPHRERRSAISDLIFYGLIREVYRQSRQSDLGRGVRPPRRRHRLSTAVRFARLHLRRRDDPAHRSRRCWRRRWRAAMSFSAASARRTWPTPPMRSRTRWPSAWSRTAAAASPVPAASISIICSAPTAAISTSTASPAAAPNRVCCCTSTICCCARHGDSSANGPAIATACASCRSSSTSRTSTSSTSTAAARASIRQSTRPTGRPSASTIRLHFRNVTFYAPQMPGQDMPVNTGRPKADVKAYSWSLKRHHRARPAALPVRRGRRAQNANFAALVL